MQDPEKLYLAPSARFARFDLKSEEDGVASIEHFDIDDIVDALDTDGRKLGITKGVKNGKDRLRVLVADSSYRVHAAHAGHTLTTVRQNLASEGKA